MAKRITTEIIINATPERIWHVLTNFTEYPQWNPFIVSVEGNAVVGARLRNTMKNNGKTFVFKPTVLGSEPGRHFAWLGSLFVTGIFDGYHFFNIESVAPGQTKLTQGEEFSGILSTFILGKIGTETLENFIRMNQALKKRAESNS
jgi:hypothetical protein